mmetsp:Transcript_18715/g.48752  ORF Transcript_18715/g.48752 Transcript_18715/m.48752 type:complete len:89 (+) Transcript_18715:541-807(+)
MVLQKGSSFQHVMHAPAHQTSATLTYNFNLSVPFTQECTNGPQRAQDSRLAFGLRMLLPFWRHRRLARAAMAARFMMRRSSPVAGCGS